MDAGVRGRADCRAGPRVAGRSVAAGTVSMPLQPLGGLADEPDMADEPGAEQRLLRPIDDLRTYETGPGRADGGRAEPTSSISPHRCWTGRRGDGGARRAIAAAATGPGAAPRATRGRRAA